MERHQIENPDLKNIEPRDANPAKSQVQLISTILLWGRGMCITKSPLLWQHHKYPSSTNALPLLQNFTMQAKLDRVGLANLFISPTSGGAGSSRACLIIQHFCGGLALKHGDSSAKSNEHWWG
jgi:hypothetical protein